MNSNTTTFLSTGDRTEPYRAVFDPPRTPERPFPHGLRAAAPSFAPGSTHTPPSSDVRVIQNPQVKAFTEIDGETRFGQK